MLYYSCKNSGVLCWKLKTLRYWLLFVFLKHNGLCGRFADSNYFYTGINIMHEFSCTRNDVCVHVRCTVVTMYAICEGLLGQLCFKKKVNISQTNLNMVSNQARPSYLLINFSTAMNSLHLFLRW